MSQDQEFEKYLAGKTNLSKLYAELPQVELPDHLDAAILAEAHRAVNSRPGAKLRRSWTIPLGMVATLFVVVMAGLQLPAMLKDAAQPQQPGEERMAELTDKSSADPTLVAPLDTRKSQIIGNVQSGIKRNEAMQMPAEAEAPAWANAPAPVVASPPAVAAKKPELRERADVDSRAAVSKEKKTSSPAEGDVSAYTEPRAPAAARMAAPQPAQLNRSLMQSAKDEASEANLPAEDWLKRIQKLKQQGKLEEAKKELAEFKKRYPDYVLPKDLELL